MKRVVIVGGSYAGLRALAQLAKEPELSITLIDRHPYHFLQTEGYDLIAGRIPFDETIVGLRSLCAGFGERVRFVQAVAEDVDFANRRLICEGGELFDYDYLVIAAGAVTRFFENVSGLRSCSYGVKSLRAAFKLKQFFEEELYKRLESAEDAQADFNILIGGAGLSGVEIAAEMQAFFNRYYRANALACGTIKIHLADKHFLKGLHPTVVRKSKTRLERLGVHLHIGAYITKVAPNRAYLDNETSIPFDFMLFTGGIVAAPFVQRLDLPKNRLQQIVVDRTMRPEGIDNVFVVGDAAALFDRAGRPVPPTAQSAEVSGTIAGRNIVRLLHHETPLEGDIRLKGLAIALGGRYAIVDVGAFRIYGFLAYFGKKVIEKGYKWPLKWRAKRGFATISHCKSKEVDHGQRA